MRLQKKIANSGYCSRREAEKLIMEKKVYVNDELVCEQGYIVNDTDEIRIDDTIIASEEKVYFALYKPKSVVSTTTDDKKRKTVTELLNTEKRVYPVGRLDYDTTGLILLTNDGDLANNIMHPKSKIEKEYTVKIDGILNKTQIELFRKGILVEDYKTKPARIRVLEVNKKLNRSIVSLVIKEGKNHQVKNMFKAIGFNVIKLKRERIAFITLEGLREGEHRHLTIKEVHKLYAMTQKNN